MNWKRKNTQSPSFQSLFWSAFILPLQPSAPFLKAALERRDQHGPSWGDGDACVQLLPASPPLPPQDPLAFLPGGSGALRALPVCRQRGQSPWAPAAKPGMQLPAVPGALAPSLLAIPIAFGINGATTLAE